MADPQVCAVLVSFSGTSIKPTKSEPCQPGYPVDLRDALKRVAAEACLQAGNFLRSADRAVVGY